MGVSQVSRFSGRISGRFQSFPEFGTKSRFREWKEPMQKQKFKKNRKNDLFCTKMGISQATFAWNYSDWSQNFCMVNAKKRFSYTFLPKLPLHPQKLQFILKNTLKSILLYIEITFFEGSETFLEIFVEQISQKRGWGLFGGVC